MKDSIIPETYEEWRHCITVDCGLEFTNNFVDRRIAALEDNSQHYTQQFIRRYGKQHHQSVLSWFKKVKTKL